MTGGENDTYGEYSVDNEDQPHGDGDSLVDNRGLKDPMDEGYSPPERWSAAQGYGNTPYEESVGESLDRKLAQEEPEVDPYDDPDPDEDEADPDERQVGGVRAGRLADNGADGSPHDSVVGTDVGIDGAGASAEEAAMHVIDEDEDGEWGKQHH